MAVSGVTTINNVVFIPEVYMDYGDIYSPEKTTLVTSGIVANTPQLMEPFGNGGVSAELPYWNDLDANSEPNSPTTNPNQRAAVEGIDSASQRAVLHMLNKPYGAASLITVLAGSNPMRSIREKFGMYWNRQFQRRIVATLKGVMASNIANNGGDMVHDISVATAPDPDANMISFDAVTDARTTSGDAFGGYDAIFVHSTVHANLVKQQKIITVTDAATGSQVKTYNDLRVFIDDTMPVEITAGVPKFTSFLLGRGALAYASRPDPRPVEVMRDGLAANGGGVDTIIERKVWLTHPLGYRFTSAKMTNGEARAQFANNADLADATNWVRTYERKLVPMAFLVTNG